MWTVADDIFVIFGKDPSLPLIESIAPFGVKVAIDRDGASVLTRITAGFRASNSENCLVVPSSAPFVKPNVLFQLFESIRGYDAAVPRWRNGKIEPLLAVYNRKAFLKVTSHQKKRSLGSVLGEFYDVTYIDIEKFLKPLDPELSSFFRIENPSDLMKARRIASAKTV